MEILHSFKRVRVVNSRVVDFDTALFEGDRIELIPAGETYKIGGIWIDPQTHHIMQMGLDNKMTESSAIYAVGAMTRGRIIDASMARGIVQATSRIADDLVDQLIRTVQQ